MAKRQEVRSVQVGGIPFSVSAERTYSYEDAMENLMQAHGFD